MSLVARLEACKGKFGSGAARKVLALLERVERTTFRDPQELIHLHETVLFLRAYPQSSQVMRHADRILFSFGERLRGMPYEEFEYSDVSASPAPAYPPTSATRSLKASPSGTRTRSASIGNNIDTRIASVQSSRASSRSRSKTGPLRRIPTGSVGTKKPAALCRG
jgi:hypothetical protein